MKNTEKQAGVSVDYFINGISSGVKLKNSFANMSYFNKINGSNEREINANRYNLELQLTSTFKGKFNYGFGFNYENNKISTSFSNNYYNSFISNLDLYYRFNDRTSFNLITERYSFIGKNNPKNAFYFVDFKFEFNLSGVPFSLNGYNLLNINQYKDTSIYDFYSTKNVYRLPSRFFSIGTNFDF